MAVKDCWNILKVAWTDAAGLDGSWSFISLLDVIAKAPMVTTRPREQRPAVLSGAVHVHSVLR